MIQELESCHGVHEQTDGPLAQQFKALLNRWPNISIDPSPLCNPGQPVPEEKSDTRVDDRRRYFVEDEDIGRRPEKSEVETGLEPRLRSTGDKNLTLGVPSNRPIAERMADCGSSSTHSSNASMMIAVEISRERGVR